MDPNEPAPEQQNLRWKKIVRLFKKQEKLPKSQIPLTEKNLTVYFNPDYNEEHDAYHPVQGPRKISVSEWIQLLP